MKKVLRLLVIIVTAAALAGCVTARVQQLSSEAIQGLLSTLPHSFTGKKHVDHANPYFQFSIDFDGLKWDDATKMWTWTAAKYSGHSAFTATNIGDSPETQK